MVDLVIAVLDVAEGGAGHHDEDDRAQSTDPDQALDKALPPLETGVAADITTGVAARVDRGRWSGGALGHGWRA
jgi:hypothetical protein